MSSKRKLPSRNKSSPLRQLVALILILLILPILMVAIREAQNLISFGASQQQLSSSGLSQSKLGIFILDRNTSVSTIMGSGPRVIKVLIGNPNAFIKEAGTYTDFVSFVKNYKTQYPDGKVVLRIFDYWQDPGTKKYSISDNPEQAAEEIFGWYEPVLRILREKGDIGYFDYLGGPPNETERTPYWSQGGNVAWLSAFWSRLVDLNYNAGIKTCAGNILTGDLPISNEDLTNLKNGLFAKLNSTGGVICYHGYSDTGFDTNAQAQEEHPLEYRRMYRALGELFPRMIIGELGIADGWQKAGTAQQYEDWLTWYDSELQKDSQVIGATIYEIGGGKDSNDIEPIAEWLADYLRGRGGGGVGDSLTPTPTVAACVSNFCFLQESPCCFDPMCAFLGALGRGNRCTQH